LDPFTAELREFIRRLNLTYDVVRTSRSRLNAIRQGLDQTSRGFNGPGVPLSALVTVYGCDNAPLSGASVSISDGINAPIATVTSDGSGHASFSFFGPDSSTWTVSAAALGYENGSNTVLLSSLGAGAVNVGLPRDRTLMAATYTLTLNDTTSNGDWTFTQHSDTIAQQSAAIWLPGRSAVEPAWIGATCIQGHNDAHATNIPRKLRFFMSLVPLNVPQTLPDRWQGGFFYGVASGTCAGLDTHTAQSYEVFDLSGACSPFAKSESGSGFNISVS
jgi:hypothetical protein